MRLARGSGLSGLAGIRRWSEREGVTLARPFLDLPKARLVATLKKAGIAFAEDPTNRDPRFARPRLRGIARVLAEEGLDAARLAGHARRFARADAALAATVDAAESHVLLVGLRRRAHDRLQRGRAFHVSVRDRDPSPGPRHRPHRRRGAGRARQARIAPRGIGRKSCRRPAAQAHPRRCGNRAHGSPAFGIPRARAALPEGPVSPSGRDGNRLCIRAFPC